MVRFKAVTRAKAMHMAREVARTARVMPKARTSLASLHVNRRYACTLGKWCNAHGVIAMM